AGWAMASAAYVAADLLTGSTLSTALMLNGANVAGIGAAYLVCVRLSDTKLRMEHPTSLLHISLGAATGACVAGLFGIFVNRILFGGNVWSGWTFWFVTEFVNYIAILPVILSAPRIKPLAFNPTKIKSS